MDPITFRKNISLVAGKDIVFLSLLSCLVLFFLVINSQAPHQFFHDTLNCISLAFVIFTLVFGIWLILLSKIHPFGLALRYARICMSAFLMLTLLLPYRFFYNQITDIQQYICLGLIGVGVAIFYTVLTKPDPRVISSYKLLAIGLVFYAVFFSILSVLRYLNYQTLSPPDVGLYSQIQWNNIHGRFFQSSTSGSNFVTHNSPFLIFLAPFYAIYPQPQTLLVLKILLLTLSAYPFFLVARHFLDQRAALPLTLSYLFFPFIVGQTFNGPHEICYIPLFLLFCFYFFLKNKFQWFMLFLLICLTIKEHLALISIMFGLYALVRKKNKRWVLAPILLGLAWGLLSIGIMYYFQQIYHTDPAPAWLIENIKRRFTNPGLSPLASLWQGLQTSSISELGSMTSIYLLLSPMIVILPFFSPIWLLGLPEIFINLLAVPMLFYPTWHYNIVASCFLLVACAQSIKRLSTHSLAENLRLPQYKIQILLSWSLLICILLHFFLWSDFIPLKDNISYVRAVKSASRLIPPEASISVSKTLASHFSNRHDYYLLSDTRKGEYVMLDKNEDFELKGYNNIFDQDGIKVFKRLP